MTPTFHDELTTWFELQAQLAQLKDREMILRKKLFAEAFPAPEEGTNSFNLPDAYVLKGTHKLDRKIDLAAYNQLLPNLRKAEVPVDRLLKWDPSLVTGEYRTLTPAHLHLFDQILIIKPGAPSLEIVLPKKTKK